VTSYILIASVTFFSVASREKGYQALPLHTFHRHHVGGEPGNEAVLLLGVTTRVLAINEASPAQKIHHQSQDIAALLPFVLGTKNK